MGLKSLLNTSILTAFDIMGTSSDDGLQQSIIYSRVTTGAYSTTTGVTTSTTSTTTIEGIVYAARDREVDGIKIKIGDKRAVFPYSRISFIPSADDYVTIAGIKWEIVNSFPDASESIYTLFIRST